jgi:hypothetical protein
MFEHYLEQFLSNILDNSTKLTWAILYTWDLLVLISGHAQFQANTNVSYVDLASMEEIVSK